MSRSITVIRQNLSGLFLKLKALDLRNHCSSNDFTIRIRCQVEERQTIFFSFRIDRVKDFSLIERDQLIRFLISDEEAIGDFLMDLL